MENVKLMIPAYHCKPKLIGEWFDVEIKSAKERGIDLNEYIIGFVNLGLCERGMDRSKAKLITCLDVYQLILIKK